MSGKGRGHRMLVGGLLALVGLPLIGGALFIGGILVLFSGGAIKQSCSSNTSTTLAPAANVKITDVSSLQPDQLANARTIVGVASSLGLSTRDALLGLMVALQESVLRNLPYGDRDSLGLFQQRPSQGWGTPEQILNPVYSANKFFSALVAVPNRNSLSLLDEAVAVQRPNYADYARTFMSWQPLAGQLLGKDYQPSDSSITAQTVSFDTSTCPSGTATSDQVEAAIQVALGEVGKPYVWGGDTEAGGFDCSGLMLFAFGKVGIKLPRTAAEQYNVGTHVTRDQLQRGDLVFWGSNPSDPSTIDHVALYLGNNQIVVAPHTGALVGVNPMYWAGFVGGTRLASLATSSNPPLAWQFPLPAGTYTASLSPLLLGGVTYMAPAGTQVFAASDGRVTAASINQQLGIYITLAHAGGVQTTYSHLSAVVSGLNVGTQVKEGDTIGSVGSTGLGFGNRLSFAVSVNGHPTDPVQFLRQQGVNP